MLWRLQDLINSSSRNFANINGKYVPARPLLGPFSLRLKAAWEVFRGRADAVIWPEGQ